MLLGESVLWGLWPLGPQAPKIGKHARLSTTMLDCVRNCIRLCALHKCMH